MKDQITALGVCALSDALQKKEISACEVAGAYLEKISACDGEIGAYLTVLASSARKEAARVDELRAGGEPLPPLAGVPAGIKDNICTSGVRTTCASKMLETFIPPYDAFVMEKLAAAHAVILGKLNMDEFAMGSTTENSAFQRTRNPVSVDRVPGGSSGGSAAAVAAFEAPFALGSDTGGSIRQPAAFCGVVGMKPTYGAVSRRGLVAFASSLDQIGPLTRSVRDNAAVLEAIAGYDRLDSTSVKAAYGGYSAGLLRGVRGMKIALPKEYFGDGMASAVREGVLAAAKTFEAMGAYVSEVSLPTLSAALPAYYLISSAEASSNLERFDGVKYGYAAKGAASVDELYAKTRGEGFGAEVKRRIMLGTFALSAGYYDAYYKKAQQVRTLVIRDFARVLGEFDMILAPVVPTTAYRLGEKAGDPMQMYLGDIYTVPVNIAGLPALSMPTGHKDADGLPVGMQLIGRAFGEAELYRAGGAYEAERSAQIC